MAQKELTIKINIQGTEVVLKGAKQIELFTKNIQNMKDELTKLGDRTAENAEQFDKLVGDINSLEQAFAGAAEEAKKTNEEIKDTGDESEKAGEKTQSYAAQIRKLRVELAGLGERTAANAEEYDRLTTQIVDLSEKQEDLQFGTKKLDDSLSQLPGPIGKAAQGFKVFDDGLKNARSAMANLTRTFPILKNAIAATGLGALVILFGLLVAAVMKAFSSFKPLQDAVGKLGIAFDLVMKLTEPLIELIGNGLTVAMEGLAKAVAFVTGNMDEYNKAVANKAATEALAANVKKQEEFLDANAYKFDEFTQRKLKANIEYNKKVLELNADETKSEANKQALLKQYRDKADFEINQADKDRQKKADDLAKTASDKAEQKRKANQQKEEDYLKRLSTLENENALMRIKDENEREKKKLEFDKANEKKEIDRLEISESKKLKLKEEVDKKYILLAGQLADKLKKEQDDANKDLLKQIRDINTAIIKDEKKRLEEEAKNRRDDAEKAIDETKATEEQKAAAKLAIRKQYDADIAKIDEDIAKKDKENVYKQIEFERESRKLGLQNKLTEIDLGTQAEVQKIKDRSKIFAEQTEIDRVAEIENLNKLLATKEISQKDYEARVVEINKQASLAIQTNTVQTERAILEQRQANRDAVNMLAGSIGNLAQAMGEETAAGQALIKMQQALTLATTISAIADQLKGLGQAAKLPFPGNIVAIATFIGTIGTALVQFKTLFGMGPKDLSGKGGGASAGGAASVAGLGRNYADGGLIGGRRHAQGGTLIEAEAGEAIMTRGAVTMFAPMLSAMNQMGGGTSFNRNAMMSSYDAPVVDKPAQAQEPLIMKTYVVSNDLTTEAEKQARLKDLSTL